jgi:hypothetical protein
LHPESPHDPQGVAERLVVAVSLTRQALGVRSGPVAVYNRIF